MSPRLLEVIKKCQAKNYTSCNDYVLKELGYTSEEAESILAEFLALNPAKCFYYADCPKCASYVSGDTASFDTTNYTCDHCGMYFTGAEAEDKKLEVDLN